MAHGGYHNLQQWNLWLGEQFLGIKLLEVLEKKLTILLGQHFGKHASVIGVPNQYNLLNATKIPCHTLITPLLSKDIKSGVVEGDFHDLPILTGSLDLVILPHTLQFIDNPRQLLVEACRIIKPEGLIVIAGFNPYSSWGLKKLFTGKAKKVPWTANFLQSRKIMNWLKLADFVIEKHTSILYTPPFNQAKLYQKFNFLEKLASKWFPILGGVYIIIARAKVIPLTPIRLKWKQQLSGIRISPTLPGNIARQLK